MNYGNQQPRSTPSTQKVVFTPTHLTVTNLPSGTSGSPPEVITPELREEKVRVFKRVEQSMENFRCGQTTRFQALTNIVDELDKWSGATDGEREHALNSYLPELKANFVNTNGNGNGSTMQPSRLSDPPIASHKRRLSEGNDLADHQSKPGNEEEEDELLPGRKQAREEDMPWYTPLSQSTRRSVCVRTCNTLQHFGKDLPGTKSLLCIAHNLPDGIPTSQWDRILCGESVDLNQIFASMHFIHLNEERKGRMGDSEIIFAVSKTKCQIRTGAEWSATF
jgi:hypothetical protein